MPENPLESENSFNILIVEDDLNIQNSLKLFFQHKGYSVLTANNGLEGLDALQGAAVDAVVLDIMMPRMNGIAFLEKAFEQNPSAKYIVVTGYADIKIAIDAMKKGASDFITKPFQYESLEEIIHDLLTKKSRVESGAAGDVYTLNEKLELKLRELSALYSIGEAMENTDNPDDLFVNLVNVATNVTESESGSFYLSDKESGALYLKTTSSSEDYIPLSVLHIPKRHDVYLREDKEPVILFDANGLSFLRKKGDEDVAPKSAILAPLVIKDSYFGLLVVEKKKKGVSFSEKDLTFVKLLINKMAVAVENQALYESIYNNLVNTLSSLVFTLEAKDIYTQRHSSRVTRLAEMVAREMSCGEDELEIIRFAGILHDIGKIGISDEILQKPSRLTDDEYKIIQMHPMIGARILEPLNMLPQEKAIILHHHERWDGNGYPGKLQGKDIPFLARIISLADAWDAMTSNRVYRKSLPLERAVEEIKKNVWSQFDGNIVRAFESLLDRLTIEGIQKKLAE